jgi:hypothetical protein
MKLIKLLLMALKYLIACKVLPVSDVETEFLVGPLFCVQNMYCDMMVESQNSGAKEGVHC